MKQSTFPIVGGYYKDDNLSWSSQDTLNWLPTSAEKAGTRTPSTLVTPPGLRALVTSGATIPDSPVRGVYNCEGTLFAVVAKSLYSISIKGVCTELGTIPSVGRVYFADNLLADGGNELLIVNGQSGYVWNTSLSTFTKITDDGYPGAIICVYIGSYLVQIDPTRRFAFNSAPDDALTYNELDRFTSEVAPDLMVSMAVSNNELIIFSARSTEFFQVTSNAEQPIRTKGISLTRGCAGTYTVANMDNTVYWLGDDGIFYCLSGYSPIRKSTRPIEQAISGLNWSQAFAFVWEDKGHKVCYWTFPDGQTWGYDVSADEWHRRGSYEMNRWRISGMVYWNNQWIAGDFQNGTLWVVDWDTFTEGDINFISERTNGVLSNNHNRVIVSRVELIMALGQLSDDVDHYVRIQYSDDGGYNWSNWDQEDIGATGEYGKRIVFTRQGSTYNRTYRVSCSSPRRRDLMGGAAVLQGTLG